MMAKINKTQKVTREMANGALAMGAYIYRVTATTVRCSDGQRANVAVYGYAPYNDDLDGAKCNARLYVLSGCAAADRYAASGKLTDRIVLGNGQTRRTSSDEPVYANPSHYGTFLNNEELGTQTFPQLDGIRPVARYMNITR